MHQAARVSRRLQPVPELFKCLRKRVTRGDTQSAETFRNLRTSKTRVLRLMREAQLLAPQRRAAPIAKKAHNGTISTDRPNEMWRIDATATVTLDNSQVTAFAAVDHSTAECVGIHVVKHANAL